MKQMLQRTNERTNGFRIAIGTTESRGKDSISRINKEEIAELLNRRMLNKEGGNNQRLAIMLGMLTNDKSHPVKANIPKRDRSRFSQERWKFFLEAPFEISNKCCNVMKKEPAHRYSKESGRMPITGQMASESKLRTQKWLQYGCNAFELKNPISNPLSFWNDQDILLYIKTYGDEMVSARKEAFEKLHPEYNGEELEHIYSNGEWGAICSIYGDIVVDYSAMGQIEGQMSFSDLVDAEEFDLGKPLLKTTLCDRTGCFMCGFGCHLEKGEPRFVRLKRTHPKHYKAMANIKNNGVNYFEAIDWINEHNGKGEIIKMPSREEDE